MKLKLFTLHFLPYWWRVVPTTSIFPNLMRMTWGENEVRMVTISANMSPETRVSYTETRTTRLQLHGRRTIN